LRVHVLRRTRTCFRTMMNRSSSVFACFVFFLLVLKTVCKEKCETRGGDACASPGMSMFQFTRQPHAAEHPVREEAEKGNREGEGSIKSKLEPNIKQHGGMIIEKHGKLGVHSLNSVKTPTNNEKNRTLGVASGNPVECNSSVTCVGDVKGHGTNLPRLFLGLLEGIMSATTHVFAGLDRVGMFNDVILQKSTMTGLVSGLCLGLLDVIAPDHLGTIMTLSSATTKGNAFAAGVACGLGHSFGLVFVATVFLSFRSAVTFNVEAWEYYGNYLVGASMILCALYFIMREATFIVQNKDGTYTAKPCSCHSAQPITPMPALACLPCDAQLPARAAWTGKLTPILSNRAGGGKEHAPEQASRPCAGEGRDVRGALIGLLQGACCPQAMVGLSFLAAQPVLCVVFFLVSFVAVSALGTASVAVVWAWVTSSGVCGGVSPKFAYRMSCCFTLALGILWVTANYWHILEKFNYSEAAEQAQLSRLEHG